MLLECSEVGATIDVQSIPRPEGVALLRWLQAFPSYGFVLSVREQHAARVAAHFQARDIACARVGQVDATREVWLRDGAARTRLWDLARHPFISPRPGRAVARSVND